MTSSLIIDFDRLSPAYPQNPILIIQAPTLTIISASARARGPREWMREAVGREHCEASLPTPFPSTPPLVPLV